MIIKKIFYVLYKFYSKGATASFAYYKAMAVMNIPILLNAMTILKLFKVKVVLTESRPINYLLIGAFYVLPYYFLFNFFIKEKDIEKIHVKTSNVKLIGIIFIFYCVLSMILFVIIARKLS